MTLLLGFAAVNTGNNLLYLLVSAFLGFMAVSGIVGRENIAGLGLEITLPDEVYDGRPTLLTVRLHNRKRFLPAFLIRVEVGDRPLLFTAVGRRATVSASAPCTFAGRGTRPFGAVRLSSPFPINFFVRRALVAETRPVTVFPRPQPSPPVGGGAGKRVGTGESSGRGYEGEISRIADYRGEPLKLIHWKLSARQDDLKVREHSAALAEPLVVDVAALPGGPEERLRRAAYLVNRCLRENRPVGLRLGGRTLPAALSRAHKLKLLTELANHGQA